jgi:hypothetical protein
MARKAGSERKHGARARQRSARSDRRTLDVARSPIPSSEEPRSTVRDALSKTITDAQTIGAQLSTAGLALARSTAQLAWDIATLASLAGTSVVGGTVAAAREMVERAEGLVFHTPEVLQEPARKPLRAVGGRASRRRSRETPAAGAVGT